MEAFSKTDTPGPTSENETNGINFINSVVYPTTAVKDVIDGNDKVNDGDNDDDDVDANKQRRRCLGDLQGFSKIATLHGLSYITSKESSTARRLAWTVVVIGMMVVFIRFGIINNVLRYLDRPINTITTVNYVDEVDFPAVTICNYNQWKKSLVKPEIAHVIYLLSSSKAEYPDQETLDDLKAKEDELEEKVDIFNMTHQIEDMLYECTWNNVERCTVEDFTRVLTEWGVCYTFNNPANLSEVRTVKHSGSSFGLSMRIGIEQDEYILGDNGGAGLRVLVHQQHQLQLMKSLGFSISPGFESHVGVRQMKIENLEYPYRSNCRKHPLKYAYQYSMETCYYECYVDYVLEACGCRDYRMPGNARVCTAYESITCINNASTDFISKEKKCECPTACTATMYDVRVSSTYWPSSEVTNLYLTPLGISEQEARKNYMDVKIYFEYLSYQKVQQIPAYDIASLFGDIGGYMGLLCEMSLTTLFEFVDFFLCAAVKRWKRR